MKNNNRCSRIQLFAMSLVRGLFLLALWSGSTVHAATIGFENTTGTFSPGDSYVENGLKVTFGDFFTVSPPRSDFYQINGPGGTPTCVPSACTTNGTNALFAYNTGASVSIVSISGSPFSLQSFDGAPPTIAPDFATQINVRGTFDGGYIDFNAFIASGPNGGFQTYVLPNSFSNLLRVDFYGGGSPYISPSFAVDNMNITLLTPVPLPAAFWLFGSGLVGLLGFMRRY